MDNKIVLKLNEEQQGLKLIQVNDGFVVVDLKNDVKEGILYNDITGEFINTKHKGSFTQKQLNTNQSIFRIIFATPNLNLESVSVIEDKYDGILNLAEINSEKHHYAFGQQSEFYQLGFLESYKQAHQELFTEEQVREAIEKARTLTESGNEFEVENILGSSDGTYGVKQKYSENEIIQSLKQPKVEITFENDKLVKCVLR